MVKHFNFGKYTISVYCLASIKKLSLTVYSGDNAREYYCGIGIGCGIKDTYAPINSK